MRIGAINMQGYGIEKVKQLSIKKGFSNKPFLKPFFMLNEIVDCVLLSITLPAQSIPHRQCYRG